MGGRSPRRGRSGQRYELGDGDQRLVLGSDRSDRRRRPCESRRLDRSGGQPRVPPVPDRIGTELRDADALRDFCIRNGLLAREIMPTLG